MSHLDQPLTPTIALAMLTALAALVLSGCDESRIRFTYTVERPHMQAVTVDGGGLHAMPGGCVRICDGSSSDKTIAIICGGVHTVTSKVRR